VVPRRPLSSPPLRARLNAYLAGEQAVPIVNKSQFSGSIIALPNTGAEQQAIAEALSDADALIESLEQLVAKKRLLKQGAMQELLTGKRRLPGFTEEWEFMSIGSLCDIAAGRDLVREDFSPVEDHRHEVPIYSNALTNNGLYGYSRSYQYERDKVTVTARGEIGYAVYRDTRFCAIGRLLVLSAKRSCALRFVAEQLNHSVDFAVESTGVPQLTAPQISTYEIDVPPAKSEQSAIAAVLSDMDAEIEALEARLAKLRAVKQGMMQELLTGRMRLV
jgi:type I restriction enzyme S subunit